MNFFTILQFISIDDGNVLISSGGGVKKMGGSMRDDLYRYRGGREGSFRFDEGVAEVFDDMLERSIPLYAEGIRLGAEVLRLLLEGLHSLGNGESFGGSLEQRWEIYDLGSSTGNFLFALADVLKKQGCGDGWAERGVRLIGVDGAGAMTEQAEAKFNAFDPQRAGKLTLVFRKDDVRICLPDLEKLRRVCPGVVVPAIIMQYTLQFIPRGEKSAMLARIGETLMSGGGLLISEKLRSSDEKEEAWFTRCYEDFKKRQGYDDLEIARKRRALVNVLVPLTFAELSAMLIAAGFEAPEIVLQWYNFVTLLVIKK